MNSKTNYNYLKQASFLFCKYELMKLQLSMRRLRLVFVIFEILFENTEKLLYATKCRSITTTKTGFSVEFSAGF